MPITDNLCRELLPLVKMKGPDEPVFDLSYGRLDYVWKRTRKAAGLSHVRFKDLRAQISIYGEEAGVPLTVLAHSMVHRDEKMALLPAARRHALRRSGRSHRRGDVRTRARPGSHGGVTRFIRIHLKQKHPLAHPLDFSRYYHFSVNT